MTRKQREQQPQSAETDRVAEFGDDKEIEGGFDWSRPDRTRIPKKLRKGFRHRHARNDRVEILKMQGWEVEEGFQSQLPGHTLMRLPEERAKKRDEHFEQLNRLNEMSVSPEAVAARLASEGGQAVVPKRALKELDQQAPER